MLGVEVIAGGSVLVHDLQDHGAGRGASMGDSRLSGMVVVVVHACFLVSKSLPASAVGSSLCLFTALTLILTQELSLSIEVLKNQESYQLRTTSSYFSDFILFSSIYLKLKN